MRTDSVLVIPFADGIGDFINVQPLLAALKRAFPRAAFTVAASEHGNQLINDPTIEVVKPSGFDYEPGRLAIALRPLLPQTLLAWMAGPTFDRELGPFDLVINFFYAWERGMDFKTWRMTPMVAPAKRKPKSAWIQEPMVIEMTPNHTAEPLSLIFTVFTHH